MLPGYVDLGQLIVTLKNLPMGNGQVHNARQTFFEAELSFVLETPIACRKAIPP